MPEGKPFGGRIEGAQHWLPEDDCPRCGALIGNGNGYRYCLNLRCEWAAHSDGDPRG